LDVVLIYRKDRSMAAAQRKFIEAISAEAELAKVHTAIA
jgi:hypothetical protein